MSTFIVESFEEAKNLQPKNGDFVVINSFEPEFGKEGKDCEGSSLPKDLQEYREQLFPVVIVKITDKKVKFYAFPAYKSLCCMVPYHLALSKLG